MRSISREMIRSGLTTRALSRRIAGDQEMANDNEPCTGILVVDDDPDIRDSLREVLEDEGYTVNTVGNGREALDYLHRSPRPCVILLDLMMPVMDGWQFRREQKQDPAIATIPLVVITATGKRPVLIDADELVMKPLDLGRLFEAIEKYCS
ncbi:MAG TPA: response regulator [Polyangia bacterium]|nr:response regulator [Polyangia bacterium]